jgi:hypothetical protein
MPIAGGGSPVFESTRTDKMGGHRGPPLHSGCMNKWESAHS